MSKDTNQLTGHSDEADGIEEYDNPLPDWWVGLFWFTILWGIGYGVHYVVTDRSQVKEFAAEMAAAEIRWPDVGAPATDVPFTMSGDAVTRGKSVFDTNCVACHGANLEGGIGPSFTDAEWIHGNAPSDLIRVITEGVPAKGMLAWGPILTPEQIRDVTAYILSRSEDPTGDSGP